MNWGKSLVQIALTQKKCTQKELATLAGVSPTQITNWKNGADMSYAMVEKFREITQIGDIDPDLVVLAGSVKDAEKWIELFDFLGEAALLVSESPYPCDRLMPVSQEGLHLVISLIDELGIELPKPFPAELIVKNTKNVDWESKKIDHVLHGHPYSSFFYKLFKSFTELDGFFMAYCNDYYCETEYESEAGMDIELGLFDLAATKIGANLKIAPKYKQFEYKVKRDMTEAIKAYKQEILLAGKPLKAELLDLVNLSDERISYQLEKELFGFQEEKLHPDIYMNELLTSTRKINALMPLILKKLGISEDEVREAMNANGIH